ncbi:MAG: 50S ribosomal protein L35 [Vicinamibacteria bacterium]
MKRFKVTASAKFKRHKAMKRHILTKKAPGRQARPRPGRHRVGRGPRAGEEDAARLARQAGATPARRPPEEALFKRREKGRIERPRAGVAAWKRDGTGRWGPGQTKGRPSCRESSGEHAPRQAQEAPLDGEGLLPREAASSTSSPRKRPTARATSRTPAASARRRNFRRLWIAINAATRHGRAEAGRRGPRPQVARRDRGQGRRGLREAGRKSAKAARRAAPRARPPAPSLSGTTEPWPTPSSSCGTGRRPWAASSRPPPRASPTRPRGPCATASSKKSGEVRAQ